jgi:tyrosinase
MRKMAVRKNQAALSAPEKQKFVQAVLALKAEKRGNTNTYDRYVWEHRDTAPTDPATGEPSPDYAHAGPAFFPWHREYLLRFEADLQRISGDPNLGLPYWDWSVDQAPPSWPFTADFLGGNGRDSDGKVLDGEFAFDARKDGDPKKWVLNVRIEAEEPTNYLRRQFGKDRDVTSLPTPEDVRAALRATPYDVDPWNSSSQSGFRNIAEGFFGGPPPQQPQMHNRVHVWVGGSMGPMTSPNDPVFFLHHCFVDKLWADRLNLHSNEAGYLPDSGAPQGHNYNDPMRPWNKPGDTVRPSDVVDWHYHRPDGYSYCYDLEVPMLSGLVHIQARGNKTFYQNSFAGTRGEGLSLEGFNVLCDPPVEGLGMEYMAHIQEQGDTPWVQGGNGSAHLDKAGV